MKTNIIQTKDLSKYYGSSRGIIDLNLAVEEGDCYGFIGPNGAGKSTTIRCLLGMIRPTGGLATVFGLNIAEHKTEILSRIGYMPSEAMFYRGMRVRDMIQLSADLHNKDCRKKAAELTERLQLDTNKKIEELSLGNRKKVSIVCAMQHEPELFIFDEPTSGLDPLMQAEFFSLIREQNEKGVTVFLSSHVLTEIQKYCSHAGVVRDGKMIQSGLVSDMAKSNTKRITLHGTSQHPDLPDLQGITVKDKQISFLYSGDIKVLLKELDRIPFTDISIEDPSLEEIFMHFYQKEDK